MVYRQRIKELCAANGSSLSVSYLDLNRVDSIWATWLVDTPEEVLAVLNEVSARLNAAAGYVRDPALTRECSMWPGCHGCGAVHVSRLPANPPGNARPHHRLAVGGFLARTSPSAHELPRPHTRRYHPPHRRIPANEAGQVDVRAVLVCDRTVAGRRRGAAQADAVSRVPSYRALRDQQRAHRVPELSEADRARVTLRGARRPCSAPEGSDSHRGSRGHGAVGDSTGATGDWAPSCFPSTHSYSPLPSRHSAVPARTSWSPAC